MQKLLLARIPAQMDGPPNPTSQARVRLAGCCVPAARHLHVSAPPHSQHVEPARKEWKSPHDWSELVQNYGKRRDVFDEPVEIHKLTVTCRSLKEQGSRYSQKIRAGDRLLPA